METLADYIDQVLNAPDDRELQDRIRADVREICQTFPIYRNVLARHEGMLAV